MGPLLDLVEPPDVPYHGPSVVMQYRDILGELQAAPQL